MLSDLVKAYEHERGGGRVPAELDGVAVSEHFRRARPHDPLAPRPFFVDKAEAQRAGTALAQVLAMLAELPQRMFDGDHAAYGRLLGLRERQIRLALRTGRTPELFCRADLYHDGEAFRALELNASSALGGLNFTELNRGLLADPGFAGFADRHRLGFVDPVAQIAEAVRAYLGRPDGELRIALLDWPSALAESEPNLRSVAALLGEHGLVAPVGHVGEVTAGPGGLRLHGEPLDGVYRFFTLAEIERTPGGYELVEPLVRAHEDGSTPMFLPLSQSFLGNKSALGLLSAELDRFGPDRAEAVRQVLPWARRLDADLLGYCVDHQQELVLKGATGYRGEAVLPGWTVDAARWREALDTARHAPHIVQRRVVPAPSLVDGQPWSAVWGVFVVSGAYAGCRVRTQRAAGADVIALGSAYGTCVFHRDS